MVCGMYFCSVLDQLYRPLFSVEETVVDNVLFRSNHRKPDVRKMTTVPPQAILYQKPPVKTRILKNK